MKNIANQPNIYHMFSPEHYIFASLPMVAWLGRIKSAVNLNFEIILHRTNENFSIRYSITTLLTLEFVS